MHIQYSLNGHHEIVQPGRVSSLDDLLAKSHPNQSSVRFVMVGKSSLRCKFSHYTAEYQ